MKKLYGCLAAGSALLLIGTVGGMEVGNIGLLGGMLISIAALAGWLGFTYLAGGFEEWEEK